MKNCSKLELQDATSTVCFAYVFMTGKEKLKLLYLVWIESWLCAEHDGSFLSVIEPLFHKSITKSHKIVAFGTWSNSDVYQKLPFALDSMVKSNVKAVFATLDIMIDFRHIETSQS